MLTDGTDLAREVDARCRLTGEFTPRSGAVSQEYFDKYRFEADPLLLRRVAEAMVTLLPSDTQVLGGLELG
ncbi:MAG: orotate phosphoribosyltransferase, partial [Oryzihumus sp.]